MTAEDAETADTGATAADEDVTEDAGAIVVGTGVGTAAAIAANAVSVATTDRAFLETTATISRVRIRTSTC